MIRGALTCILLLASAVYAGAVLDLSPIPHEHVAQGIVYKQLKFKDATRTVVMDLPNRWTYRGSASRLQLTPPDTSFTEALLEVVPVAPQPPVPSTAPAPRSPLDQAAMQALEQQALAAVPPGSQFVTLVSQREGVAFVDKPRVEIVVSYQTLGEKFRRSSSFVEFADFRLVMRVTAKESEFEKISDAFYRAVLSLTWEQSPVGSG